MEDSKWYVLQVYSGHENKVKIRIEKLIENMEIQDGDSRIKEVMVPTEEVTELRNGKKVRMEKKLYPGYVLINMIANEVTLHTLNNTQGIIKVAGGGASVNCCSYRLSTSPLNLTPISSPSKYACPTCWRRACITSTAWWKLVYAAATTRIIARTLCSCPPPASPPPRSRPSSSSLKTLTPRNTAKDLNL